MTTLAGRVAIVTGGGGGIGGSLARMLVEAGVRVAVADLDMSRAQAVAEGLGEMAFALALDVTNPQHWTEASARIEQHWGYVDILCSNAGVGLRATIDEIAVDAWRWVYDVNVIGTLHALQTFLPGMKARGRGGHILVTSSITALRPFAAQAAYTSSKAALLNLATALKMELQETTIGVSVLCPGLVATKLYANALDARPAELLRTTPTPEGGELLAAGMAPHAVARAAVEAIREDRFFVFTHSDYRVALAADMTFMLEAMATSADPTYREPAAMIAPIAR